MDLPGRPGGSADHVSLGAAAWEHLAWEIWNVERRLDQRVRTLLEGWSGPGAEAFGKRWGEVRAGFPELDHHLHTVSDHLRVIGFRIQDGQEEYDLTLAEAGIVGVAGIAATVLTAGGSDLVAGEADAALAASLAAKLAELGVSLSRLGQLLSEVAEALGNLASRFALNLAVRVPQLAESPAGGAAVGAGMALASGVRDPVELAASGLLGVVEEAGGGRRGVTTETTDESENVVEVAEGAEIAEAQRLRQLGMDPATGAFRSREMETAGRIEEGREVRLRRSTEPRVDWVDSKGKTYDAVGNFDARYFEQQWPNLQERILDHLSKADYVVIDVSRFNASQVQLVKTFITDLGQRVFLVGE
jgi:uncharacterized protein YukE